MSIMPQLRVRSECSFRKAYGPIEQLADVVQELGCSTAALVDTDGTWGHSRWAKAMEERGIQPGFGTEFKIKDGSGLSPSCWVLAEDIAQFYRLSSSMPTTQEALAQARGVIRFAGDALTDPESFDYIDLNPRSLLSAKRSLDLHRQTGKPLVLTSDCDYPKRELEPEFMAWVDNAKMTQQHLLGEQELRSAFWFLDDETFCDARRNTFVVAERLQGVKLRQAPMISVPGDLRALAEDGRKERLERGHIPEWTEEYQKRLEHELNMIESKSYESYFLVVADLVCWAKQHMLVGPARGSSAGSLVCYLLKITEVDPIPFKLLFERFIDVNRDDLPDIDIDFNDQKRHLVFDYLAEKYGSENVARIGSLNTLKPRSVLAHVGKKMGIPASKTFPVVNVLIEYSSGDGRYGKGLEDTLNNTAPGRQFTEENPEAAIMGEIENHASHTGVHAAGIIVSNVPVVEYCTVREGVAQVDKKDAEHLNLLKIDALGLRTLGVIEDSGCISNEELYDLSLDDPAVFRIFNEGKFSGVFQFEGAAQRRVSLQVPIDSFKKIDHVTALARPGPLGGGAAGHYINRNSGDEAVAYRHPTMEDYLSDTMGVVLYQEQVMRIVRELGQFSWGETSVIRKAMSGAKGREFFDQQGEHFAKGALELGINKEDATAIWEEICSFGAWGMNKAHTCSYAVISYWCAYMKAYHPLKYAAACLRSAKDEEQTVEILRELDEEGVAFEEFDPMLSEENWTAKEGRLLGGFRNLVGIGPVRAKHYVQKREEEGLSDADLAKISKHKPRHSQLYEARELWGAIYQRPEDYNIHGRVKEFKQLKDRENAVVICKLIRKDRRDENETVRLKRRGSVYEGQSLFLDMFVVDDSVSKPVLARIRTSDWERWGEPIADNAVDKKEWFLMRGVWLEQFSMLLVRKIKCLSNKELVL